MPRLGAEVCLLRCTLLSSLLLLLVCSIHETEQNSYCQQIITQDHLAELQELADTQMQHPGRVSFTFIEKMQLDDPVCYVKAAFPLLGELLAKTEFKENSSNGRRLQMVRRMYGRIDENVDPCIREEDDEERQLSQKCSREFTTSPYEMLALVKQFFHDLSLLLQAKETFEKDCSRVYRERCPAPTGSSPPGVGTDPAAGGLSPAPPSATQPSLAVPVGRDAAPGALVPSADGGPPAGTDGGSGSEEAAGAPASPLPAAQQPAAAVGAEGLPHPPGSVGPAPEDVPVPRGGPRPLAQPRVSRTAEAARGWGLDGLRQPPGAGAGPSADSRFVPGAEQRRREPKGRRSRREPLAYVAASAVAVLLAVGGLLFYKYKCRVLERRLDERERDPEEPERRALQGAQGCAELEMQQL